MATRLRFEEPQPSPFAALDALLAALPSLPRPVIARLVARAIERLDEMDGDPDAEEVGLEDSFGDLREVAFIWIEGPGCPLADPGGDQCDDEGVTEDAI